MKKNLGLVISFVLLFLSTVIVPSKATAFTNSATISSAVFKPAQDAGINSQSPNTNYGRSTAFFDIGTRNGAQYQGLMKFDISSLPANATITKASLRLHIYAGQCANETQSVEFKVVSSNWAETTVTWNNKPASIPSLTKLIDCHPTDSYAKEFDILSIVNQWYGKAVTNNGILFAPRDSGAWWLEFMSKEAYNYPILNIEYSIPFTTTIPAGTPQSVSPTTPADSGSSGSDGSTVAPDTGNSSGTTGSASSGNSSSPAPNNALDTPAPTTTEIEHSAGDTLTAVADDITAKVDNSNPESKSKFQKATDFVKDKWVWFAIGLLAVLLIGAVLIIFILKRKIKAKIPAVEKFDHNKASNS